MGSAHVLPPAVPHRRWRAPAPAPALPTRRALAARAAPRRRPAVVDERVHQGTLARRPHGPRRVLPFADALPLGLERAVPRGGGPRAPARRRPRAARRSEEHTSELQSPCNLVCRLPLEKKNMTGKGRLSA